ncbi:hypothetical protein OT109_07555 [Phycisphaeraceae bacterium D3-23]
MTRARLLALLMAATCLVFANPSIAGPAQTQVGEPFPDLVFPTVDGESAVRLSDHQGKRVLLIEFASW